MLLGLIEHTRQEMLSQASLFGFTSSITITTSQRLDYLLNLHQKHLNHFNHTQAGALANPTVISVIINGCENLSQTIENSEYEILLNKKDSMTSLFEIESILNYLDWKHGSELIQHIGTFVPKICAFPEDINSFETSLLCLNTSYHLNHVKDQISSYETQFITSKEIIISAHTPVYSVDFTYGIIRGLESHFNGSIRSIKKLRSDNGGAFKIKLK